MASEKRASLVAAACVLAALARAYSLRWTCDDAFLSFRYADNLASGLGLVFNAGERVEGYTNFLWTLAIAGAFRLGIAPETFTRVVGALAFGGTVLVLARLHRTLAARAGVRPLAVPFAALAAACHPEWAIHAVSGLETGMFTLLVFGAFAVLLGDDGEDRARTLRRSSFAGLLLGLGALTRPDGVVFGAATLVWLAARPPRRSALARVLACAAPFAILVLAHLAWRASYYGDLVPNTYHAKSGGAAWYAQGLVYAWLYALRFPPFALAPLAVLWLASRAQRRPDARALLAPALAALAIGLAHAFWVVRVGGDFMFARFLVPATPFAFFALDAALLEVARARPRAAHALAAALALLVLVLPSPVTGYTLDHGILDEHAFYADGDPDARGERASEASERSRSERVRAVTAGLPLRVAFYGAEARFVYHARFPYAIEAEGGLTSRAVATQPLAARGRVGHEKHASAALLVDVLHADLSFSPRARKVSDLDAWIPYVPLAIDGVPAQLLRWDPEVVRALRERGVAVPDYPAALDAEAPTLDALPRAEIERRWRLARHFYFAFAPDPERERRFTSRLGLH